MAGSTRHYRPGHDQRRARLCGVVRDCRDGGPGYALISPDAGSATRVFYFFLWNSMKTNPGPVMLDVVGKTLSADDTRRLAHPMTGGVILFARHYENRAQLIALTDAIRA